MRYPALTMLRARSATSSLLGAVIHSTTSTADGPVRTLAFGTGQQGVFTYCWFWRIQCRVDLLDVRARPLRAVRSAGHKTCVSSE